RLAHRRRPPPARPPRLWCPRLLLLAASRPPRFAPSSPEERALAPPAGVALGPASRSAPAPAFTARASAPGVPDGRLGRAGVARPGHDLRACAAWPGLFPPKRFAVLESR